MCGALLGLPECKSIANKSKIASKRLAKENRPPRNRFAKSGNSKVSLRNAVNNSTKVRSNRRPMMIPGRPAGDSRERKGASCARGEPAGAPVSGEALPAHEGQRGTPVSGKALPAREAISEGGGLVALLSKRGCDE